jgi:DNA-binding NarL/FixJ family response regulator
MPVSIAITDDHHLMAVGVSNIIQKFDNHEVLFIAENGSDLLDQLQRTKQLPDIVLLDISMPIMNGFDTALKLKQLYPSIKVLALSMTDREDHIIRMLRNGARGYLLKDCRPSELRQAFSDVMSKGYYYSDFLSEQLIRNLNSPTPKDAGITAQFALSEREQEFVKIACSELTYGEVADKMFVAPRTVDGYRESVFQKMNVKTRVGMVIEAVRHGLVEL